MSESKEVGQLIERRLRDKGIFHPIVEHRSELEEGRITSGYGYPIIGLEKFLGYFDKSVNIANFPSISMLTDFSHATAFCKYVKEGGQDSVILDGKVERGYSEKAVRALEFFKDLGEITGSFKFYIERKKRYSEAKGLGESAAVAAATARALVSNVFGEEGLKDISLTSRFARLVSGSGTRSVSGAISLWLSYPYIMENHSFGMRVAEPGNKIHFGAFPLQSKWVTDNAHRVAESSEFYGRWISAKFQEIISELDNDFDLEYLMKRAQQEMFTLNSIIMSRGFFIQTTQSLPIINDLKIFQEKNAGIYFTADTGPSIVVMSQDRKLIQQFVEGRQEEFIWGSIPERDPPEDESVKKRALEYFRLK